MKARKPGWSQTPIQTSLQRQMSNHLIRAVGELFGETAVTMEPPDQYKPIEASTPAHEFEKPNTAL
jgi:hypothetical protein